MIYMLVNFAKDSKMLESVLSLFNAISKNKDEFCLFQNCKDYM